MPTSCARATRRLGAGLVLLALGCSLSGLWALAAPVQWRDPATGLALGGYDPLAYFTRRVPRMGDENQELIWRGGVWRFLNSGNRAAFMRNPEVYAPRFAGYDPTSVAIGRPTRGHPAVWAIHKHRLYLFHNAANRRNWMLDPDGVIARAEGKWPVIGRALPGNSIP